MGAFCHFIGYLAHVPDSPPPYPPRRPTASTLDQVLGKLDIAVTLLKSIAEELNEQRGVGEDTLKQAEAAARRVARVEKDVSELLARAPGPYSVPPARGPYRTQPGFSPEDSQRIDLPPEALPKAVQTVLDGRELEASRKRRDTIKGLVLTALGGGGTVLAEQIIKAILGHH